MVIHNRLLREKEMMYNEAVNNEMSQSINGSSNKHTKIIVSVLAIIAWVVFGVILAVTLKKGQANQPQLSTSTDAQTRMRNQAISQLTPIQPATPEQIQQAIKQLSGQKPMTDAQRTQAINQAVSQLKAQ
jgi:hypothetical protein